MRRAERYRDLQVYISLGGEGGTRAESLTNCPPTVVTCRGGISTQQNEFLFGSPRTPCCRRGGQAADVQPGWTVSSSWASSSAPSRDSSWVRFGVRPRAQRLGHRCLLHPGWLESESWAPPGLTAHTEPQAPGGRQVYALSSTHGRPQGHERKPPSHVPFLPGSWTSDGCLPWPAG